MNIARKLIATLVVGILSLPSLLYAQNEGTYIDNLGVQDSSYMEEDLLETAQSSGSNTAVIVIIAIVLIAAIVFFLLKRKKKSNG